jgi:hypothetical protein
VISPAHRFDDLQEKLRDALSAIHDNTMAMFARIRRLAAAGGPLSQRRSGPRQDPPPASVRS